VAAICALMPLGIAQYVEMQGTGFFALYPSFAQAREVILGRAPFQVAEDFFLGRQAAGGIRIAVHEDRNAELQVIGQPPGVSGIQVLGANGTTS
jgi:hypothetical protein